MNLGRRRVKSILGMAMAVLGGVAWFYQIYPAAAVLWGGAVLIMLNLNKRKRRG